MENEVLEQSDTLVYTQADNTYLPVSESTDELITLNEFKEHFEKRIFERLGIRTSL